MAAQELTGGQQFTLGLASLAAAIYTDGRVTSGAPQANIIPTASGGVTAETSTVETFGLVAIGVVAVILAVKFIF